MKTLLTISLLLSTLFGIKDTYFILRFDHFVDKVAEKYELYTDEDWTATMEKYSEFRTEYKELAPNMTSEQRAEVNGLFSKINAVIIKHKTTKALGKIGDFVNEATGTIKELKKLD
jgi:hypothetical protein